MIKLYFLYSLFLNKIILEQYCIGYKLQIKYIFSLKPDSIYFFQKFYQNNIIIWSPWNSSYETDWFYFVSLRLFYYLVYSISSFCQIFCFRIRSGYIFYIVSLIQCLSSFYYGGSWLISRIFPFYWIYIFFFINISKNLNCFIEIVSITL